MCQLRLRKSNLRDCHVMMKCRAVLLIQTIGFQEMCIFRSHYKLPMSLCKLACQVKKTKRRPGLLKKLLLIERISSPLWAESIPYKVKQGLGAFTLPRMASTTSPTPRMCLRQRQMTGSCYPTSCTLSIANSFKKADGSQGKSALASRVSIAVRQRSTSSYSMRLSPSSNTRTTTCTASGIP